VKAEEGEFNPLVIYRIIRRRILFICLLTLALTFAGLPSILPIQRYYYSESRLLIRTPLATSLSEPGDNLMALDLSTEVARLLTRSIAVRLINELHLLDSPEFNPELATEPPVARAIGSLRASLRPAPATPAEPIDKMEFALPTFLNALSVQRLADVIVIGFTSRDPTLAAAVPNALVRIYLDERGQMIQERVHSAEGWIDARIAEQRERVEQAQAAAKTFRETEVTSSEDLEGEVHQSLSDLLARRATIQANRSGVQATLSALESAPSLGEAAEAIDSTGMTELRRDLQRQEAELGKLLEVYGDNYPSVVDARAHVQEAQLAITKEAERHIQSLRNQIEAFDRQERTISTQLEAAESRLARARTLQARLDELGRKVEVEQTALADLESQKRSLETQAELPVADVEILSPASTPLAPLGRGRSFYLLVWFFVSGILAVTVAFGLELLDRGVRGFEQLDNVPNVKPAGLVPRLPKRLGPIEALRQLRNHFSDGLSSVAMTLERAGHGDPPTSLFVTSGLPSEGKSTLSLALAIVLTARGRRVLLVDGDPRHGTVHRSLKSEATPGLSDFLSGRSELPAVIRRSEALGIDFIPRGSQAIALHDVGRAREIMSYAREQGMIVIVDGPPALATTETLALAGLVERNLVVARWGKTTRREVELAIRRLHEWNLDEVFLVLNMVNVNRYPLYGFKDAGLFAKELRKYYGPLG
jgi:uncharacterized protein involved in exopolysaccharide biosynthesis/Mrp family chromosome partitioning ATPase